MPANLNEDKILCTECLRWFDDNDYDTGKGDGCQCHDESRKDAPGVRGCYTDKLDGEDQIDTEESIAALLWTSDRPLESEEDAQQFARDILLMVLTKFRPDLVTK